MSKSEEAIVKTNDFIDPNVPDDQRVFIAAISFYANSILKDHQNDAIILIRIMNQSLESCGFNLSLITDSYKRDLVMTSFQTYFELLDTHIDMDSFQDERVCLLDALTNLKLMF